MTATIKRLADRRLVDHTPVPRRRADRRRAAARPWPSSAATASWSGFSPTCWVTDGRKPTAWPRASSTSCPRRSRTACSSPCTGRRPAPTASRSPARRCSTSRRCRRCTPWSRATWPQVALPGSTGPDIVAFLDTLGLRPGVEVEVSEKHPFDGPLVLRVGGTTGPSARRSPSQIFVQNARSGGRGGHPPRGEKEQSA